jgi:hypothetical protein
MRKKTSDAMSTGAKALTRNFARADLRTRMSQWVESYGAAKFWRFADITDLASADQSQKHNVAKDDSAGKTGIRRTEPPSRAIAIIPIYR